MSHQEAALTIDHDHFDGVLFDLDGVVTMSARVHAAAWKKLFDEYLRRRDGDGFEPFDAGEDYREYVDGKPRYDGVRSFLAARGIELPEGSPDDEPDAETVCGLGNRKNRYFLEALSENGVDAYPSTVRLLHDLRAAGFRTAVVSSSANCREVVEQAGLSDLFDARVDGVVSRQMHLEGKPAPDIFVEAAHEIEVIPQRAVVVEDALSGVEAGHRGHFGCVVGVDREGAGPELGQHGADVVVHDLRELAVDGEEAGARTDELPAALESLDAIVTEAGGDGLAVFLDYDGTLTPIVERPEDAVMGEDMRRAVRELAARVTVGVISGRDLPDVRSLVDLDGIYYAGSHGFDIVAPEGERHRLDAAEELLPVLDEVESALRRGIADIPGAEVERKRYAVATHYRRVEEARVGEVSDLVDRVLEDSDGLRRADGKKVIELRPELDWDKGSALLYVLDASGAGRALPLYLGDDTTDEDAFRVLRHRGLGVVVADAPRRSAAHYVLRDPDEVRRFLVGLLERIDRETS